MIKQVVTALKIVPVQEAVTVPFVAKFIDDEGRFEATPILDASATALLEELAKVTAALSPLREEASGG